MTYLIVPRKISDGKTQFWPIPILYGRHRNYIFLLIFTFLSIKSVLQIILMYNYWVKILCRRNNITKNGYNTIKLDVRVITVDK